MRAWNILSALAAAGILTASSAYAGGPPLGPPGSNDRAPFPYGQAVDPDGPGGTSAERTSLEGQVTSLERETGHLVLDTDEGPVSLVTEPDELTGIDVGDTVRVSLVRDEPRH
jgi:hypothetical protein